MEQQTAFDGIIFMDTLQDCKTMQCAGRVIHVLCRQGSMSMTFQDTNYNISAGDYVIMPNGSLMSDFSASDDFQGILMALTETFIASIAIKSNYGIIGHLSLMQNPVMRLSAHDFELCEKMMLYLRERMNDQAHLFREEMLGYLLMAHILDLYDIHARGQAPRPVPERTAKLLQQFVDMLYGGEYITHRDVPYYASRLCVTPHYLSEICRKTSGKPATYWIDRFTLHEIANLLCQKELTLTDIADRLHFSSVSYFSRYVKKQTGLYPTAYRNNLWKKSGE